MSTRFDSQSLMTDFDVTCVRKSLTPYQAATRCGIDPGTLSKLRKGAIEHITVNTMAKMLEFIGTKEIEKYLTFEGQRNE